MFILRNCALHLSTSGIKSGSMYNILYMSYNEIHSPYIFNGACTCRFIFCIQTSIHEIEIKLANKGINERTKYSQHISCVSVLPRPV